MSFSSECKTDMILAERKDCCSFAFLYGVSIFSSSFSKDRIVFSMPSSEMLEGILAVYRGLGYSFEDTEMQRGKRSCCFAVNSRATLDRLFFDFGYTGDEPNLRIRPSNFLCEDCRAAFLSGAFVAAGSVTDPRSGYHMELSTHRSGLFSDLCALLAEAGFEPRTVLRGYSKVAYYKESSVIEDLLTFLGSSDGAMKLMDLKIYKDIVNNVNRRMNCENANIDKTITSSSADIDCINYILAKKGAGYLPNDLLEVAELRLRNPELSLAELGGLTANRLTKSGVSHRLSKLRAEAKRIKEEMDAGD